MQINKLKRIVNDLEDEVIFNQELDSNEKHKLLMMISYGELLLKEKRREKNEKEKRNTKADS